LALRPSLLLLDEPFTGLDMPTQELLSDLFVGLAHEGRAVLMTTHDILAAFDVCDRLVLLNRTVVGEGTPDQLTSDPQLWMRTFGVGENSPLLRVLKVTQ
jgi:manganese/iron transport system ATP-binding protein